MIAPRRRLGWSAALLVAACTRSAGAPPQERQVPLYSAPVALVVQPDSLDVERLRRVLGDEAFYITADDAMWYQAEALERLDSLGIPHPAVERGEARFVVRGRQTRFSWRNVESPWFLVLYDGENEPEIAAGSDLLPAIRQLAGRRPR